MEAQEIMTRPRIPAALAMLLALSAAGCNDGPIAPAEASSAKAGRTQRGEASYYAAHFHGRRMANGEVFNRNSNAAAHRSLPLGTTARVTNLENGRSATVKIKDRGPFVRGRIIDVSPHTAEQLGMKKDGTVRVAVTPLSVPDDEERRQEARR